MNITQNALKHSFLSQYFTQILALISAMVFARVLTPDELGVYAISSAVVIILNELKTIGITKYLIREHSLTKEIIQSALGLTILFSWTLGGLLYTFSSSIADFYEYPAMKTLFRILAIGFLFSPYISVWSALLTRELKFKKLLLIRSLVQTSAFIISLGLVLQGFSYFSLAWGVVISSFLEIIIIYKYRQENFELNPSFKQFGNILQFGLITSSANLLSRFSSVIPDLVIGKLGSTVNVAVFSRGFGFLSFLTTTFTRGVAPVTLPYLSITKREGNCVVEAYTKAAILFLAVLWPCLAVASEASYPAILLMFGGQWGPAAPIASILAWYFFTINAFPFASSLLINQHKEKVLLVREILLFCSTLTCVYLGYQHGLLGVAYALVLSSFIDFIFLAVCLSHYCKINPFTFLYKMRFNFLITLICLLTTKLMNFFSPFNTTEPFISLILIILVLPPVWFFTLLTIKHPLYLKIIELISNKKNSIKNNTL
jgi:O-antigen/teichoic acid export membrane protein